MPPTPEQSYQNDQAWAQVQEWLDLPVRRRKRLRVTGQRCSGKSAFLREIAERTPGAVFVDCLGLTAEEVAVRVWGAAGAAPGPEELLGGRAALRASLRGDHTVLLANAQWAGRTHTSSEPRLIDRALSFLISSAPDARIRLAVEGDGDRLSPPGPGDRVVTLPGAPHHGLAAPPPGRGRLHPLGILAAAELTDVPEEVYRLLHEAAAGPSGGTGPADWAGLPDWAALESEYSGVLTVRREEAGSAASSSDAILLSFRSRALAQEWREAYPLGEAAQCRVVEALMAAGPGPVGRYACRALPAHAVLGGVLPDVLLKGEVVARLRPLAVWDALGYAFPDGVPQGGPGSHRGFLADIRAIEARGADSLTQGEWAAWLHHAAVSAGRTELAARISGSGVRMPWRTVWSRWRPGGAFGPLDGEAGRVDEITLVPHPGATGKYAVSTARGATTARATDPDHKYVRQEWDPATGERLVEPVVVPEPLNEADWIYGDRVPEGVTATFAEQFDGAWDIEHGDPGPLTPCPRPPLFLTQGVEIDGVWVLAGEGGLFAVTGTAEAVDGERAWRDAPLIAPHAKAAAPDLPPEAAAAVRGEEGSRAWLEESFGAGACRPRPEGDIPDGVTDPRARRFLAAVGLPDVEGFLHLRTTGGLSPAGGEFGSPDGETPVRYAVGSWMHAELLLDGTTGELFRTGPGTEPELVGGSLPGFFVMVRLFDTFRRTFYPSPADRRDAQAVLASWCARIDPVASGSETWDTVLGGTEFEDGTWDLVSRNGRPPL
ncbi:SUKH-4 family immunity protein [Streptomyces sp. NPDC101393]|uniref:SUKH-4 family immunity protein n=1 Tax=Streptomyces sp. NPDC101393 TaxID=3366141 RepID=UPI003815ADBE